MSKICNFIVFWFFFRLSISIWYVIGRIIYRKIDEFRAGGGRGWKGKRFLWGYTGIEY